MRTSIQRSLVALLVAGAVASGLAATAARANSGASANGIDACIGVVGGCAPNGAGYVLGGIQMYGEQGYAYEHPYETHRRDGGYPNGY